MIKYHLIMIVNYSKTNSEYKNESIQIQILGYSLTLLQPNRNTIEKHRKQDVEQQTF